MNQILGTKEVHAIVILGVNILRIIPLCLLWFLGCGFVFASAPTAPSEKKSGFFVSEFPEIEARASSLSRVQIRAPGGSLGTAYFSIYSALAPLDVYQFERMNFRMGVLSPVLFGIGTLIPLTIAFPSTEGAGFVEKYYLAFLLPGYLLNPEIKIQPIDGVQIFSGYSYNLVHDKRIRPVFSGNAGLRLSTWKALPKIRLGFERIWYRGENKDCLLLGMALAI